MSRSRVLSIMSGDDRSAAGAAARIGLSVLTPGYRAAVVSRNRLFDAGWRSSADLGRPTISVGNLTTGGTGKTPMVIELCARLLRMGQKPAVLLRGYKGRPDAQDSRRVISDETEVYRQELGIQVPVEANPSRALSAGLVLEEKPEVTCFVLDDGFQHRQARRDLDLVLIDATNPWGYGHLLPRGLLREPKAALKRADAVIVTRADQADVEPIDAEIEALTGAPPIACATHVWTALRQDDRQCPVGDLARMRVLGVCGVGNPAAFGKTLAHHARQVAGLEVRDDHHPYDRTEIAGLLERARQLGVDAVVTTEKDFVKWRPHLSQGTAAAPVLRPVLGLAFLDGADAVDTLLARAVGI